MKKEKLRAVHGLKRVEKLDGWPEQIPKPKPRKKSAKAEGLRYEKRAAEMLASLTGRFAGAEVLHGQWLRYFDANGPGLAQPDVLVVPRRGPICIVEAKLTYRPSAEYKLKNLYSPLVKKLYLRRKQRLICITKNLTPDCATLTRITTLEEAVSQNLNFCVWHWRPK